jgi:hypothetical protein
MEIIENHVMKEYNQDTYFFYHLHVECEDWYMEIYNMEIIDHYFIEEYNKETSTWSYWEAGYDDWYMNSFHFWDEKHLHVLFYDSTPPYVEHILESR